MVLYEGVSTGVEVLLSAVVPLDQALMMSTKFVKLVFENYVYIKYIYRIFSRMN